MFKNFLGTRKCGAFAVGEEGFSLIELITAVVIVGVLAAIAIPIFVNQQKAAMVASVKNDVRNTNTAIAIEIAREQSADVVGGIAPVVLSKTHPYFYVGNPEGGLTPVSVGASERSEEANTMATISDPETVIEVRGAWDTYSITATHPKLSGGVDNFFEFRAASGEYVGEGDLA